MDGLSEPGQRIGLEFYGGGGKRKRFKSSCVMQILRFPFVRGLGGSGAWWVRVAGVAVLVGWGMAGHGGDQPIANSAFDADAAGWNWETWSAAGSAASYASAENAPVSGGTPTSGALKLECAFGSVAGYQQAVFTVGLAAPENYVGQVGAVAMDVKVDAASAARLDGDYGFFELILRQGDGWAWVGLPGVRLLGTEWQRVTFQVPKDGVDSIRGLTLKLGDNDFLGPVTLYVDNIAYITNPDDVWISGVDNGVPGGLPEGWSWETWSVAGFATYEAADTRGRSTSGTVRLEHGFENLPGGYQQTVFTYVLPGGQVNAAEEFSHVNLDVKVEAGSTPRAGGDYGWFQLFLRNGTGWDWVGTDIGGADGIRITDNEWHHLSFQVRPSADAVHRLTFKVGDNALLGPVVMQVDNISFTRSTAPPPPPTLAIAPAQGGLSLVATSPDQYGRHNLYTVEDPLDPGKFAFVNSGEPVSYAFTLDTFPDAAAYPGFQAHIFLVPGYPGTAQSPDWNEPTLIFMDIKAGAGNTGNATFRIKTDQAGNNTELYGGGEPHTVVNGATVTGTWTITGQGQVLRMTAPDGTVSDPIDIGAEAAALFAGEFPQIRAYFGIQPNAEANKGQSVRVGRIEIKRGTTVLLSDSFAGTELDTTLWTPNAAAGGVLFVPPADAGYLVSWTVPDTGFGLQTAAGLTSPQWSTLEVTPVAIGQRRQALVPKSLLPEGATGFFRMLKP